MAMQGRFFQDPETHYFLFGPRGTGKSTWLHARYPDALWLDLLAPEAQRLYGARPVPKERPRRAPESGERRRAQCRLL